MKGRLRNSKGKFSTKEEIKEEVMVGFRGLIQYLYWIVLCIVLIPLLYHILIRRNILLYVKQLFDNEFGCNCNCTDIASKVNSAGSNTGFG